MEHENKGEGGTQADYDKPAIMDNDDPVIHDIGGLGYNAHVGMAQFKRAGLGGVYDNVSFEPDDQRYEFMGAIKKQKLRPAQVYTKEQAQRNMEAEGVKGKGVSMADADTNQDAGASEQLAFAMGEIKKEANREEAPIEATKEGY